jgi:hypothetical protein
MWRWQVAAELELSTQRGLTPAALSDAPEIFAVS